MTIPPINSPSRIAEKLALAAFLIVFPGYYFYHYFAAAGLIPLLIRGWFILGCVATAASLGTIFLLSKPTAGLQRTIHGLFGTLIAIISISVAYHYFFGQNFQRNPAIAVHVAATVASLVSLYLIGYFVLATTPVRSAATICLFAMAGLAIVAVDPNTLQFIATKRFNAPVGIAEYQGFALAFVATAILALGLNWGSRMEPVVLAIGFATLLILGSRSDFYGYGLIVLIWIVVSTLRKRLFTVAAGVAFLAILTASMLYLPPLIADTLSRTQQTHIPAPPAKTEERSQHGRSSDYTLDIARQTTIVDLSQSESWSFRKGMLTRGWDDIKSAPFWGVYGGQTKNGYPIGSYIHNALSAWRQFGIVAFLIYIALCAAPPLLAAHQIFLKRSNDPLWVATLYFGAFCLFLVAATKAIFWPLPALAWGLLARRLAPH